MWKFCSDVCSHLNGGKDLPFGMGDRGVLIRTVEKFEQAVIPVALRGRILHISHHSPLSGHPGGRKLYETLRRNHYWTTMSVDC